MAHKTHPIILAHGIARFDVLFRQVLKIDNQDAYDGLHYFRNIRTDLQSHGYLVHHASVEWADSVGIRSRTLKRQVEQVLDVGSEGASRVHIIAHSMGGLDARHMLFDARAEGFHERVATLTTIATPHHGSPVANSVVDKVGKILAVLGIAGGAQDLTTQACATFNEAAEDWERSCGVQFRAYAGRQPYRQIFDLLKPSWRIIHEKEGENDGLVSVASARWRDEYFVEPVLDGDHFNLCGWWDPTEIWRGVKPSQMEEAIKQVYRDIAEGLAAAFPIGR